MKLPVVAIDDVEEHLLKIVRGLGRAGIPVLPFLFEDGLLEDPPKEPLNGVRVVFTDIHLIGGGQTGESLHAENILSCLKKIVAPGPYIVVFWSQFPEDQERIAALINKKAEADRFVPPLGYASIDKKAVFAVLENGEGREFSPHQLRDRIFEVLERFPTVSLVGSWEERVGSAASRAMDGIFSLVKDSTRRDEDWDRLLAFLACEAVGRQEARDDVVAAMDEALIPVLEDQLARMQGDGARIKSDAPILKLLADSKSIGMPDGISSSNLNAGYLIDESDIDAGSKIWERGMVTKLGGAFLDSGEFVRCFELDRYELLKREFVINPEGVQEENLVGLELHVVSLDAECDHVQEKVSTRRYLVAVLVPEALETLCFHRKSRRCKNDSVVDVGLFSLRRRDGMAYRLLVSCRTFIALAPRVRLDGQCSFRLRKAVIGELMHRYSTHAARPGVMRFK